MSGVANWRVVAFQTAWNTSIDYPDQDLGHGAILGGRTDDHLVNEVLTIHGLEQDAPQIYAMSEVGPPGKDSIPQSTIDIDGGGNCWHQKRSGYGPCTLF